LGQPRAGSDGDPIPDDGLDELRAGDGAVAATIERLALALCDRDCGLEVVARRADIEELDAGVEDANRARTFGDHAGINTVDGLRLHVGPHPGEYRRIDDLDTNEMKGAWFAPESADDSSCISDDAVVLGPAIDDGHRDERVGVDVLLRHRLQV